MAIRDTEQTSAGRHIMRLEGAPRLFVLDATAVAVGDTPDEAVLKKPALLAGSEHADVILRGVSTGLQQRLERWQARRRIPLQMLLATQTEPLSMLLAQRGLSPAKALIFLAGGEEPPPGSHAFYVGEGMPPAGAVASRVSGPRGTDAAASPPARPPGEYGKHDGDCPGCPGCETSVIC